MYAFMPDIHIGAKYTNESLFQSLNHFLGLIKDHKEPCHCIFVLGDLFDHKLSVEEGKTAALFLRNLICNKCGRDGMVHVPVHFIHGTDSHDRKQYEMFLPIINEIPNANVLYTDKACTGMLRNEATVLYLPQEYGHDISYADLFSKEYDIIVGHGPVSSVNKAPCPTSDYDILHSAEQLGDISKICVFGHYHGFTDFGNNVYYGGPWLRWKFGEDTPRKFVFCNDNFEIETHPNPYAIEFKTIEIHSPEELRSYIASDITSPHRFVMSIDPDIISEYHAIMNINKNNQNISYKVSYNVDKSNDDDSDRITAEYTQSALVEPVPALISYIKDKYNVDVSDEIKEYEDRINKEMENTKEEKNNGR